MTTYNFQVAKTILSETEKDRFLACFLNSTDTNAIDYNKASEEFGSASVASFKKMIQTSLKKVKDAEAKAAETGETPAPPSTTKGKGGKKRKNAEGVDDGEETPKPKSRKGKKAKSATPTEQDVGEAEVEEEAPIKGEHVEE